MKKLLISAAVLFILYVVPGGAQELRPLEPGAVQKRSGDQMKYFQLRKKMDEEKASRTEEGEVIEQPGKISPALPDVKERVIFISKIETGPSEILTPEEIRSVTSAYEGKEADIKDIFMVIDELNELYSSKNVVTARAVLPPQKVENGVIKIKLIEAHLGNIHVEGNQHTRSSYFRNRISLESGQLVDINQLQEDLLYFNGTNDVAMRAELKAGEEFGLTDIVLKTYEPQNYQLSVFVDNAGREEVGKERIGLFASDLSLLGIRDPLSISGYITDGTTSASFTYSFPFTSAGTRLEISASYTEIEITSGPFEPLNITGDSYDAGLTLSQPLIVHRLYELDGFVGYRNKKSTTDFDGVRLFETEADSIPFGVEFKAFDYNYEFHSSLSASTGSFEDVSSEDTFYKINFDATGILSIQKTYSLLVRFGSQYTDTDLLPSFEQFQIGGLATIRGYDDGVLIGDSGYFISTELNFPLPFLTGESLAGYGDKIRGIVVLDHGGVSAFKGPAADSSEFDTITSTGGGITFSFSKYLSGKLVVGIPLEGPENIDDDTKFYFYIQSNII